MKRMWILVPVLAVCGGVVMWTNGNQSVAIAQVGIPTLDQATLAGEWQINEHSIAGYVEPAGGPLTIGAEISSGIFPAARTSVAMKLLGSQNGITQIEIRNAEDEESMGGGGPRKGICRLNSLGQLEILEATSAARGFPEDFSQATIDNSIYWCLSPANSQ